MPIEISSNSVVCSKCGTAYGKRKGYFPVSYALLHKGIQYVPICRDCIDNMYNEYLAQCRNAHDAVRQMCRKLDLYWNEGIFSAVEKMNTARSMMTSYIAKVNIPTYAGRSYDNTLLEEGTLWNFGRAPSGRQTDAANEDGLQDDNIPSEKDIAFWGSGLSCERYKSLNARWEYWMAGLPAGKDADVGTQALLKQICSLEVEIAEDRANGRTVDKNLELLNKFISSANLKPSAKQEDAEAALETRPFGLWIRKWENERPVPEPDPDLQDVDGIIRYISVWFLGHLCKMLGIRNTYCRLYEEEIARMRVERPEYDDEDDETMFNDIFGRDEDDEDDDAFDQGDSDTDDEEFDFDDDGEEL